MNLREIAEITATNLNTVKYRFYRAHRDMADLLGDWNG
jgi:DNA-directed RNA polymerase specialized sigma24 family protein